MLRLAPLFPIFLGLCLNAPSATAAEPIQYFLGEAEAGGEMVPISVRLQDSNDGVTGVFDMPAFGLLGLPLHDSDMGRRKARLGFGGNDIDHILDGRMRDGVFEGVWTLPERTFTASFRLEQTPDPRPYTSEQVEFHNGGIKLAGTVFSPKTLGPHPGIVLIHGSGDPPRWWLEWYADFFARQGLVTLFFDKRGTGESDGDWHAVGFEPLARDGLAGIEFLRSRDDVDPDRVGFWGISQAGWIMILADSLSDDVAFTLVTSGATVSVANEIKYDYLVRLRDAGYGEDDIVAAERILDLDHHVTMTGEGYDELRALVKNARGEPWWKLMEFYLLPAGARDFSRLIGGFDPRPYLETVDIPMLWMYGLADKSVEPGPNIAILEDIIAEHDKPWTIKTFPNADHGIDVPAPPNAPFPFERPAPGYADTMAEWLRDHVLSE